MSTPATTVPTTVGDLTAHDIGTTRMIIRHEGSTLSGVLTNLDIDAQLIQDSRANGEIRTVLGAVHLTVTVGSITIGPLNRDHPCEVIA